MRKLYLTFFGLLATIIIIFAWLIFSSGLFIDQKSMTIVKNDRGEWIITSVRGTPLGGVTADWVSEYRVIGRENAQTCQGSGREIYSQVPGDMIRYLAPDWALPCLEDGPPISVTYVRQVLLFGWMPLRPVSYSFVINPMNVPVVEGEIDLTFFGESQ